MTQHETLWLIYGQNVLNLKLTGTGYIQVHSILRYVSKMKPCAVSAADVLHELQLYLLARELVSNITHLWYVPLPTKSKFWQPELLVWSISSLFLWSWGEEGLTECYHGDPPKWHNQSKTKTAPVKSKLQCSSRQKKKKKVWIFFTFVTDQSKWTLFMYTQKCVFKIINCFNLWILASSHLDANHVLLQSILTECAVC